MKIIDALEKAVNLFFACRPQRMPLATRTAAACLIAHRGAYGSGIIENTEAAFDHALALNCWGIELDVQVTRDDVLVVHHDYDLHRLWQQPYAINQLTFSQLQQLAPQILRLEEVVKKYGKKLHLFIELKAPFNRAKTLHRMLHGLKPMKDYHLLSLDAQLFSALPFFERQCLLLVAQHNNMAAFCRLSLQLGYGGVLGHYLLFTTHKVTTLQKNKQQVGVGIIDSKFSLYRELNRGINWIFTNQAARLSAYLPTRK